MCLPTGYASVLAGQGKLETKLVKWQLRPPSGLRQSVGSVEQSEAYYSEQGDTKLCQYRGDLP